MQVTFSVGEQETVGAPVPVTVTTDSFALYVTLTTLAQGRFEVGYTARVVYNVMYPLRVLAF